jgi:hypothetical protein
VKAEKKVASPASLSQDGVSTQLRYQWEALRRLSPIYKGGLTMKARIQVRLTEDMKRIVSEQRLGFIASICPDGTPNLSPKGTTAVWDDEHLLFADICSPGTIANVQR